MMKKLIMLGILVTMLMGMALGAQAAINGKWVINVDATQDALATVGQAAGAFGFSTRTTDQVTYQGGAGYDPTTAEIDFDSCTAYATTYNGIVDRADSMKLGTTNPDLPSATNTVTWIVQGTNNNADTPMYITAWNLSTNNSVIAPGLGYSITMSEVTTPLNGTVVPGSTYTFTNGTTVAAPATYGTSGLAGNWATWTIPAGINNVAYFEIVAGPVSAPTTTPEPGSIVALFSGLVGLVGYGIRRRK
jgi:hypothetical protein